ncbi:MAG: 6-pyruvoyl trahydropterin synthase family protein [Bacteroidia bacterium]
MIERKFHFHAAHRNVDLGGDCRFLHGHTYHLEIQFAVPPIDETSGVTIEFKDIGNRAGKVIAEFDHSTIVYEQDNELINAMNCFKAENRKLRMMNKPTSTENLAQEIFIALNRQGLNPVQIVLQETTTSKVIYTEF